MNQSLRVLMVEDSEEDVTLFLHALRREGYEVVYEVVDTPSAMRAALERQDWDVITSDHAMPHFSAPEALALSKELRPSLPFIILSGEIDLNLAVSLMKGGAEDYIQKRELSRIVPAIKRELKEAESIIKRNQAEQALRESEERFKNLYQESPIATFTWQKKEGDFILVDFNRAAIQMTNCKVHDHLGDSAMEHYKNRPQVISDMNLCFQERSVVRREIISQHFAPGRFLSVHYGFIPPDLIIIHVEDQTERKQAEAKERANERRYRIVADNTYDWEYWRDPQYRFIYCSPSCERITGYKVEEFLSDPDLLSRIIHPKHRLDFLLHKKSARQTGHSDEIEFLIIRSDGTERWIGHTCQKVYDENGVFMGIRGSNRDITKRKWFEETLQLIMDNMTDMIRVTDLQGVNLYSSPSHAKVLSYKPEDRVGKSTFDIIHPDDVGHVVEVFTDSVINKKPAKVECRVKHAEGHYLWLETAVDLLRDDQGEVTAVIMSSRDITEGKRAENYLIEAVQNLQDTRDMLVQFEKQAVVGRLAAGVAHEILNPASIIASRLQFLEEENLAEPARENLRVSRAQLQRIVKITRDLHQSASNQQVHLISDDFRRVIEVALQMTECRIKDDHIQVEYDPPVETVPVKMAINKLVKVMVHLILNACDAMSVNEDKRLIINIQYHATSPTSLSMLLTVADNGHGIPNGDMDLIFHPFFTTKEPGKGTGLGLSVCRGIIMEHGGTIHAKNSDKGGASFIVELPLYQQ